MPSGRRTDDPAAHYDEVVSQVNSPSRLVPIRVFRPRAGLRLQVP